MLLIEHEVEIPFTEERDLISYFRNQVNGLIGSSEIPVRFAVTRTTKDTFHCEIGVVVDENGLFPKPKDAIFDFRKREYENGNDFNIAMIVPTGIGAEIGGHSGDATPAARLLASVCDTLITHPNVVNAADINEMPGNGLYTEGSVISDLMMGTCGISRSRSNRTILLIDKHEDPRITEPTINAISAARATLGFECPLVVEVDPPIKMRALYSTTGTAVGRVEGLERLCKILDEYKGQYDAIGLASIIDVPYEFHTEYFQQEGKMVNPWGGVEAMLTHAITMMYDLPTAHSPMSETVDISNLQIGVVDPRMSAEAVSMCFLHCILKGLHDSPQIIRNRDLFARQEVITAEDIACLVMPDKCVGLPTLAAIEQGIKVIAVKGNKNHMQNDLLNYPFDHGNLIFVDNYLEAAGVAAAIRAGVSLSSLKRPMDATKTVKGGYAW